MRCAKIKGAKIKGIIRGIHFTFDQTMISPLRFFAVAIRRDGVEGAGVIPSVEM